MRHRASDDSLPRLVEAFFRDHLGRLRAASPHTVRAYRDALRLGGREYPLEVLRTAGVDLTEPAPIESALSVYGDYLDEVAGLL